MWSRAHIRRYGLAHVIAVVVAVTGAAGFFAWDAWRGRNADIATARAWHFDGPPCPSLTAAEWTARHERVNKLFDYDGIKIGRWSGDASCSDVRANGGTALSVDRICQFTNPPALSIVSKAGTFYFAPGVGAPATVAIHKDVPHCVLASGFTRATE